MYMYIIGSKELSVTHVESKINYYYIIIIIIIIWYDIT